MRSSGRIIGFRLTIDLTRKFDALKTQRNKSDTDLMNEIVAKYFEEIDKLDKEKEKTS